MNFITRIFQKYIIKKDIRKFKYSWRYYFFYRIARHFLNKDIVINIFNFKINCSYKKNKTSNALIRKCDFSDISELKILEKIFSIKKLLFVDCGANYGFYSLFVASLSKSNKIFSYEASKEVFNSLKENILLNNFQNIESRNLAVASEKGKKLNINQSINDWENSIVHQDFVKKNTQEVITTNLDEELNDINMNDFLCVIKIDVEGAELEVMQGSKSIINNYKPLIIIEFSIYNLKNIEDQNKMKNFLLNSNYSIFDVFLNEEKFENLIVKIKSLKNNNKTIGNYFLINKSSVISNILLN
jgi:FkbM family methyltransferase